MAEVVRSCRAVINGSGCEKNMSETIQATEEKKLMVSEIERYDIKQESKILKAMKNIFEEQTCLISEDEIVNAENIMAVDPAHVCMVIAKTSKAKIILRRFYNTEHNHKEPNIEALGILKTHGCSLYATDYFLNIMKVIESVDDHFKIRLGTDSPCIIETDDFKFLLAPRIESE
jgi:hypothetical protein